MKIEVGDRGELLLKEVFNGVALETEEGNRLCIAMRDDTFEVTVTPKSGCPTRRFRVDMANCEIVRS